jgi:hypothetical protein
LHVVTLPGLPSDALFVLAQATLAGIVREWPGTPESPLPDRQFVSNGPVFWDCPQLAVSATNMFGVEGDTSQEIWIAQNPLVGIRGAIVTVDLMRKVPDVESGAGDEVTFPAASALTASAREIYADGVLVWNAIKATHQAGRLATCQGLAFQDWNVVGPEGGMVSSATHVRMLVL